MHSFKLRFPWSEAGGKSGAIEIEIEAQRTREHYGEMRGEDEETVWRRHAKICAHTAQSTVAFMDATGLDISREFTLIFGDNDRLRPAGADHTRLWRTDPGGGSPCRYLVTTEPYGDNYRTVERWCDTRAWAYSTLPPGFGLWLPTGEGGTRMVLASPPNIGVEMEALLPKIMESLPQWTDAHEAA